VVGMLAVTPSHALPDASFVIADGPGDQGAPALAFGGNGFLAVWETCLACPVTGADLSTRSLGLDGVPTGAIRMVEDSAEDARSPALAYNPDTREYLAVWSVRYPGVPDRYAVRARRLARDGQPLGDVIAVAEVEGVWPAAVVSSRGAWHGYDVAWAAPRTGSAGITTVINTRHLDAAGAPAAEIWTLSDVGYEALRPRALRTSSGAGALVAWFAYRPGQPDDQPRLLGVRLGLSGRPVAAARELVPGSVCAAALADHVERPELLLATIGCDGLLDEPSGTLALARLNRSGDVLGDTVLVTGTLPARDLALAALSDGDYVLVAPASAESGAPVTATLTVRRLDADLASAGAVAPFGEGEAPAVAGDALGGAVVLMARFAADWDVIARRVPRPVVATPTATVTLSATPTWTASPVPGSTVTATSEPTSVSTLPVTPTPMPRVALALPLVLHR
jgi:hypothetical protein